MAAGDLLSEGERFVLSTEKGRGKRAKAVKSAAELVTALGLSENASAEVVEKVRVLVEAGIDPKLVKQLTQAATNMTGVVGEIGPRTEPLAIEAAPTPEVSETIELVAKPVAEQPADAPAIKKPRISRKTTVSRAAKSSAPVVSDADETKSEEERNPIQEYLETLQEGTYDEITSEDIPTVANFVVDFAAIQERKSSSDRRGIVTDLMKGMTKRQSAESRNITLGSVDQAVRKLQARVKDNLESEDSKLSDLIKQHLASLGEGSDEVVDDEILHSQLTPEKIQKSTMKNDVVEQFKGDLEKIREDWLAERKVELLEALQRRGMLPEHAELVWEHVHFDEKGAYKIPTNAKKQVLTSVRLRVMSDIGVPEIEGHNPIGFAAIKKLVHTALGFNTMDTVYDDLKVEHPKLTQEEFERLVISGVIELMK